MEKIARKVCFGQVNMGLITPKISCSLRIFYRNDIEQR
jgi:hypothetical protein